MRVVVDTNVLVRAIIRPRGAARSVLSGLRNGDSTLLYSEALLDELVDVLNRPRIRHKYGLTDRDITEDLLALSPFNSIPILPPGPFLDRLEESG